MSGNVCAEHCGVCGGCRFRARKRAETRERQIRSLTERRKTKVQRDPRVLRLLKRPEVSFAIQEVRGIPMSVNEVAARLGITPQGVQLIEKRALDKVRRALGVVKCGAKP